MTAPAPSARAGEVITFYSYKGGTGRSMLLANVAWMLASVGQRVLVVDWDLEAPGLHRYVNPFLGDDLELRRQDGLIEWVSDYWQAFLDQGPDIDVERLVREYADPRHYVRRLNTDGYLSDGGIDLLCAGRQDAGYAEKVADFDWTMLFNRFRGAEFIDVAKRILVGQGGYDYVLIDSRTGVSDTSGFCTVGLADTLVVCFTYNNQSVIGASAIARDIKAQAERHRASAVQEGRARHFRLFAVPSRVDDLDPERLERRQKHAWTLFGDLLTDVPPDQQPSYWVSVQIRNQGLFAYEEVLAACMNRPTDPQSVLGAVANLTRYLTDDAFTEAAALDDDQRRELREKFSGLALTASGGTSPHDAWRQFSSRVVEPASRDAVLDACFPLLVQLFTTAGPPAGTESTLAVLRSSVLESELVADERRMAEMLTSVGVAQRRLTDDRQRALAIADESILRHWQALRQRLQGQLSFIALRDQVRQARRTWESGGRSIPALRAMQGDFAQLELSDEQGAWLGRPNLQFLQTLREVRLAEVREGEAKLALAVAQARCERIERAQVDQGEALRTEAMTQARQSTTRMRRAAGVAVLVLLGLTGLGVYALQQSEQARLAVSAERANAVVARDEAIQARAVAEAKLAEAEQARARSQAMAAYGEGTRLSVQAAKSGDYGQAIEAFNQAIAADPTLAEAYRGRALARANSKVKDTPSELADWARYYDLRPSLNGRSLWLARAIREPQIEASMLSDQLAKLRTDATQVASRDVSTHSTATRLETVAADFPAGLRAEAQATAEALRKLPEPTSTPMAMAQPPLRKQVVDPRALVVNPTSPVAAARADPMAQAKKSKY